MLSLEKCFPEEIKIGFFGLTVSFGGNIFQEDMRIRIRIRPFGIIGDFSSEDSSSSSSSSISFLLLFHTVVRVKFFPYSFEVSFLSDEFKEIGVIR